jgi:hypothetical protein
MTDAKPIDWSRLNLDVIHGTAGGRVLWQPRIGCWYDDKRFAGEPLPEPYDGLDLPDIYRALGCSDRPYNWYNPCFRRVEHPSVRSSRVQINERDYRVEIETPAGTQTAVFRRTDSSPHPLTIKWEVESEEELKVAAWREEHTDWEWDGACFERSQTQVSDLGAPCMFMPRMNVQSLYIEKMGVMRGVYAMADWPDTVEAYFRALEDSHDRLIDVINASPVEVVNFGENVHSGTLSPDLFVRYHLPACQRRCERLHAAGKFVYSHWDGDCRPLLPYARETGLDGIEAITPEPQGDVTLEEIRDALGDEMFLIDGLPAIYFDREFSEELLVETTRKILDMFAPRLILGVSDEVSSTGDIERVKLVGGIVDAYNANLAGSAQQ